MLKIWFLLLTFALGAETPEELAKQFPLRVVKYATTRLGKTHYEELGEKDKPAVVLIHGVSGPMSVWDKTVHALVGAGYRVIRYDLYGRGLSSRVKDGAYDLPMYVQQLDDLIRALDIQGSVTLVGSSFGCLVASEYLQEHGDRIGRLVFVGPAGLPIQVSFLMQLRVVPVLGDILFYLGGRSSILAQNRKYFMNEKPPDEFFGYFQAQLDVPGTAESMHYTMSNCPVTAYLKYYGRVGRMGIPVGVIWGRQDVTFPYEHHKALKDVIPKLTLATIDNAAHLPQYERPEVTNAELIKLLAAR